MTSIDLNADLGESFGNWTFGDDAAVLASISSANVACGFHAGDPPGIRETCRAAARLGVAVGAHPGYRDLAGFGRRFIAYDPEVLAAEIVAQIGAVQALARSAGTSVRYVKPHGALYTRIAHDPVQAGAVVAALRDVDPGLPLVVLPGSAIERLAREAGLRVVPEAFADRAYRADGSLVPRGEPEAVLAPEAAVAQAVRLVAEGCATTVDGGEIELAPETICLHGDAPSAVQLAREIRAALEDAGVAIRSFVAA
ncbi:LamB/YcsF family protein [Leucobacter allii]|uniref:LamB/YcsF family protein n=1 Tax=Leucobacter allii TaxID=2932247 RepID=UPI001FD2B23F|nr:5-oxoprolinase subunit PxpA [Leucobacter allii]UOR02845.1 LamB/YcsF family protein [Leucobacter allii]